MTNRLEILRNDELVYAYERGQALPGIQRRLLDQMDQLMDQGINLGGEEIPAPGATQKTHFMVGELVNAVMAEDEGAMLNCCSYLALRVPGLAAVHIHESEDQFEVDLKFD